MCVDLMYIDESFTRDRCIFSAVSIPCESYSDTYGAVRTWRSDLFHRYGIPPARELHALDLVGGRGSLGASRVITRYERAGIFFEGLHLLASFVPAGARITNVCLRNEWGEKKTKRYALDRLLNRLERTLAEEKRQGILFFDTGDERQTRRLVAELQASNPDTRHYTSWPEGFARNVPLLRLLGEPAFLQSHEHDFVQLVDFVAYALLKREEPRTARIYKYQIHTAFEVLKPVLNMRAHPSDPLGIVR